MLSEADQRRFIMVLCLRCSNGNVTLHDDEIAFQLRVSNDEWAATKSTLLAKKLIDQDNHPVAWERRQFVSDSSAERVARHRAKKKDTCNDDVTLQQRQVDTETETEKENICTLEQVEGAPLEAGKQKQKKPHGPVNGSAVSLDTFLARCKDAGERPIGDYKPVWEFAEKVGIPDDSVVLCWQEFVRKFGGDGARASKRYRDWRKAFRNCVEENWFRLWTLDEQGRAVLTASGRIAEKVSA